MVSWHYSSYQTWSLSFFEPLTRNEVWIYEFFLFPLVSWVNIEVLNGTFPTWLITDTKESEKEESWKKNFSVCALLCVCLSSRLTHGFSMVSFIAEAELLLSSLLCNLHSFHFCFSCGTSSSVFTTWSLQGPGTIWLHWSLVGFWCLEHLWLCAYYCKPSKLSFAWSADLREENWDIWVSNIICYWKLDLEKTILITTCKYQILGLKTFKYFFRNQTCLLQQCAISKSTFINVITLSNLK